MPNDPSARRLRRPALAGFALLALLVPLFIPLPAVARHDPTLIVLGDHVHVFIFAALTLLLYWSGPLAGRPLASAVAAAIIGGVSEFLQQFVGRSTLLSDFALNLIGIGLALTYLQWRLHRRRAMIAAAAFLLAVLAYTVREIPGLLRAMHDVRRSFPMLADFESPDQLALWNEREGTRARLVEVENLAGHGTVLRVDTPAGESWPGVTALHLPPDWRDHAELVVDCRLRDPAPDSLRIAVRIDDYESRNDGKWASRSWYITHEWRTLHFPLADLRTDRDGRLLRLDDVYSLAIFLARPPGDAAFELDAVRLHRRARGD